ncbi:MAG: SDR family NAD(P)-dependent oxidoreductase [Ruminococcaceae bacterium]|nr:SDR family NAD(P)-dependent oxidoreductase [Oscillospiraceae bacterium]
MIKEFRGKTAVITGAGNGFGAELAREAARRGMKLLLADIDGPALQAMVAETRKLGAQEVAGFEADLSLYENVRDMIAKAVSLYGTLDLLINNAGIGFDGTIWEVPLNDADWMIDINLKAMLWGMREAIPIMMKQGTPCHIVNVSSSSGVITTKGMWVYHATKHGVVAATESTVYDLQLRGVSNIRFSLLLPGFVQTDLNHYNRHRPERYQSDDPFYASDTYRASQAYLDEVITHGAPIDNIAPLVFDAIENDKFYVFPQPELLAVAKIRFEDILQNRYPNILRLRGDDV